MCTKDDQLLLRKLEIKIFSQGVNSIGIQRFAVQNIERWSRNNNVNDEEDDIEGEEERIRNGIEISKFQKAHL